MNARLSRMIGMAAAALALFTFASVAHATNYETQSSGDWSNSGTWTPTGVPGSGDVATIKNGHTVTVTNSQQITNLTVASGGQLNINGTSLARAALTITGGSPTCTISDPNGIAIVDEYSRLAFAASCVIGGAGSLVGQDDGAQIYLNPAGASTVTLTSNVLIHGAVTITNGGAGTGNFVNCGGVNSDAAGTITLAASLDAITDCGLGCIVSPNACGAGAPWEAGASSTLRFDRGTTALQSAFSVAGTLIINESVTTAHKLSLWSGGVVDVLDDAACFTFCSYCSSTSCTSPSSPFCSDVECP